MAATLQDPSTDPPGSIPMAASSHRRGFSGRRGTESTSLGTSFGFSSYLSRSVNSLGQDQAHVLHKSSPSPDDASVDDGKSDDDSLDNKDGDGSIRNRRASEGSHLIKGEGKRSAAPELRCDRCGKGYKHGSCLSKHMCVESSSFPQFLCNTIKCLDVPCRLCEVAFVVTNSTLFFFVFCYIIAPVS